MKSRLCPLLSPRLSSGATVAIALALALLMIFADADQFTCLVALGFVISRSDSTSSHCLLRSRDT